MFSTVYAKKDKLRAGLHLLAALGIMGLGFFIGFTFHNLMLFAGVIIVAGIIYLAVQTRTLALRKVNKNFVYLKKLPNAY